MAGNSINLEFAGDASKLAAASKRAEASVDGVGDSATQASKDLERASSSGGDLTSRMGSLGAATEGASGAIGDAAGTMQALVDIQDAARNTAMRQARALNDVAQAQEDYNQAQVDGKQATVDATQAVIDRKQALLDADTAMLDYNAAVKEHGKGSIEAKQALVDLAQANNDVKQANVDAEQATRDSSQALIDAKDAQLNLSDAQREANPPDLQKWADQLNLIAPLLTGVVGVVALVTAAQWAWNAAQLASPTTWIIVGIVALIGVIVLIATKTDWFQRAWRASWKWIKEAASNTWDFLKKIPEWTGAAFSKVTRMITAPYRAAFNAIADAWNNTVGGLSFSIPGWIPGIGGNSFSVPNIPKFHSGGTVPGTPGSEVLTLLQAGEEVGTRSVAGRGAEEWIRLDMGELGDALLEPIARAVGRRGGSVTALGVKVGR